MKNYKQFIVGLLLGVFLIIPLFVFSAPNLAEKLKGKILLAVEDKGKTYFIHTDGKKYRITTATAQKIFEKLALGISNKDLSQIQEGSIGINPEATIQCPACNNAGLFHEYVECLDKWEYNSDLSGELLTKFKQYIDDTKEYDKFLEDNLNYWIGEYNWAVSRWDSCEAAFNYKYYQPKEFSVKDMLEQQELKDQQRKFLETLQKIEQDLRLLNGSY